MTESEDILGFSHPSPFLLSKLQTLKPNIITINDAYIVALCFVHCIHGKREIGAFPSANQVTQRIIDSEVFSTIKNERRARLSF